MRYRYPTENSPFLDSGFRRNNGYAEVSIENPLMRNLKLV